MKRKINKMNMQRYFIFTGSILNRELISKIYSRTNLNMMLSTFDVFNTTITEAASQSTPSIILKKSMASPYIKHGESGYLVSESPRVIANEICKIMSDMESYYLVCKHAKHDLYKTWDQVCKSASIEYLNILKRS